MNRSKEANILIYRTFTEEELLQLSDTEFETLQKKFNFYHLQAVPPSFNKFYEEHNIEETKKSPVVWNVYKRKLSAETSRFSCLDRYARIFSLCRTLGVRNIYDIGCGHNLQAFLLIETPDLHYTGIDNRLHAPFENFQPDSEELNKMFKEFTGSDRIRFIKATFPCELSVNPNNIAVGIGSLKSPVAGEKKTVEVFNQDFDRILIDVPTKKLNIRGMSAKEIVCNNIQIYENPYNEYFELWESVMPDFEFFKLGGHLNYIFATRVSKDKEKLAQKFTINGKHISAGLFDISWTNEIDP